MESAIHPNVLGALMVVVTAVWFTALSWTGMREDDAAPVPVSADTPGPWWTHDAFRLE